MKKVILSIVCVFVFSTLVNAASLTNEDCVERAMLAGDIADSYGFSYHDAYIIAMNEYSACTGEVVE